MTQTDALRGRLMNRVDREEVTVAAVAKMGVCRPRQRVVELARATSHDVHATQLTELLAEPEGIALRRATVRRDKLTDQLACQNP